jgi:hypothetical protein
MTTGIRDARGDGFRTKTLGDSGIGMAVSIGSMAIAGDGASDRWSPPMRMITGIRDAAADGFRIGMSGDFGMSMAMSIGAMAMAGDGTMDVLMARPAARIIIARPAIIAPTKSSCAIKGGKAKK